MDRKNRAAFMTGIHQIELKDVPMPQAGSDELLIEVRHVGICGSDVHFYEHGRIGIRVVTEPFILGHKCSGIVVEAGANTKGFAPGDKVVIEPGIPCGECSFCRSGRYNLCPEVKFISTPPDHGAMRRYITHPAKWCYKLPKNVSTLEGAMIEPFAIGLHSAAIGEINKDKTVAILGTGAIGLMTLLACKGHDAKFVIATDVFDNRLEKARELGADAVVNVAKENLAERVNELTGGVGFDVVFETAGSPRTALQAVDIIKRGGTIVQVGNITQEAPYVFNSLSRLEVNIRTVFRYAGEFHTALSLMESGKVDLKKLDPRVFPFEQTYEAFEDTITNKSQITKTILSMEEEHP